MQKKLDAGNKNCTLSYFNAGRHLPEHHDNQETMTSAGLEATLLWCRDFHAGTFYFRCLPLHLVSPYEASTTPEMHAAINFQPWYTVCVQPPGYISADLLTQRGFVWHQREVHRYSLKVRFNGMLILQLFISSWHLFPPQRAGIILPWSLWLFFHNLPSPFLPITHKKRIFHSGRWPLWVARLGGFPTESSSGPTPISKGGLIFVVMTRWVDGPKDRSEIKGPESSGESRSLLVNCFKCSQTSSALCGAGANYYGKPISLQDLLRAARSRRLVLPRG